MLIKQSLVPSQGNTPLCRLWLSTQQTNQADCVYLASLFRLLAEMWTKALCVCSRVHLCMSGGVCVLSGHRHHTEGLILVKAGSSWGCSNYCSTHRHQFTADPPTSHVQFAIFMIHFRPLFHLVYTGKRKAWLTFKYDSYRRLPLWHSKY